MARTKSLSGKRERKITVTSTDAVYNGVRVLAALKKQSLNDFIFRLIESEVEQHTEAIQKTKEAQKLYGIDTDDAPE